MQPRRISVNLKKSRKFVILIFVFVISIIFAKDTLSAEYIGWRIGWHHKKQIAFVRQVGRNTPANKGDIKINDIIVSINNEKLTKSSYIHMSTKRILRGEKLIVQLIRIGKNISLPISIPAFPASEGKNIKGGNYLLLNIEQDNNTGAIFGYLWDWGATPKKNRTEQRLKDKVCSSYHSSVINIICEAPTSVDLTDERTVINLIEKAKKYAFRSCPKLKDEKMKVNISIYEGKYDNKRRGRFAPIFASFNYFSSPNYDKMQSYKNKIAEKTKRKQREEKRRKDLTAQTGKHKKNSPKPTQNLVSAKQKELEKKLKSIAGFHMAKNIKRFVIICKDSGAVFTLLMRLEKYGCGGIVIGEIPEHIDLTDDTVAKELLRKGDMFANSKCQAGRGDYYVYLRKAKFEMPYLVKGKFASSGVRSVTFDRSYINIAKELAQKERRKAEEERKKAEANKRLDKFEKKYGVTDWPAMKEFSVNPFTYEGKKVAFVSDFGTMLSATEGVFECSGEPFIVSDIPKGFFTKEAEVVIAGRPLGKKETKLPLLGEVLVPNLKFVGAYLCEKQHCKDMIWK